MKSASGSSLALNNTELPYFYSAAELERSTTATNTENFNDNFLKSFSVRVDNNNTTPNSNARWIHTAIDDLLWVSHKR